tara:strand:+ start:266 stop:547 length:282 start_codon:yes stop_codon:yes gene_type:complete
MSTEKRNQNNIVNFPGVKNPFLDKHKRNLVNHTVSIAEKMTMDNWHHNSINNNELQILSNHGETIKFAPEVAARLIAVLSTTLIRNKILEDLL